MTTVRVPIYRRNDLVAYALIDQFDRHLLDYRWRFTGKGYVAAYINGVRTYMHRAVLGLTPGDAWLGDHRNGNRLDCRRQNLRLGSQGLNQQNRHGGRNGARRDATYPRGVVLDKRRGTFSARVTVNGKLHAKHGLRSAAEANRAAQALRRRLMPWSMEAAS